MLNVTRKIMTVLFYLLSGLFALWLVYCDSDVNVISLIINVQNRSL